MYLNLTGQVRAPENEKNTTNKASLVSRVRAYSADNPLMSVLICIMILLISFLLYFTVKDCLEDR